MFREFSRQISLLVERIFHLSQIFHLLILETIRHIALEEPVRVQVRCSLCRSSQTGTINEVTCKYGIDRSNIHLTRMVFRSCFHKVFNQSLQAEQDILESLDFRQIIHKSTHVTFRLSQFRCSIAAPELVVTHHGVHILNFLTFLLEDAFRHFQKTIIRIMSNSSHHEMATEEVQLAKHVIGQLHPLARR